MLPSIAHAGLLQWGHTFTMVARKHLDDAAANGKPISDVQDVVEEQWAKVRRLRQAARLPCAVVQTPSEQHHIRLPSSSTAACSFRTACMSLRPR